MANNPTSPVAAFTAMTFLVIFCSFLHVGKSQTFATRLPPLQLGKQKLTHLHFFFHDVAEGPNATAFQVAEAPITNTSPTSFGFVAINDDLLTVGPARNSTRVGRAQGMYAFADLNEFGFMMVQNFVFDEERFNGSTLSILGRNPILSPVRELPVVGGNGVFRFASGYAEARTFYVNFTSNDAIVEYDVYVLHY